jgi:branched-subunit amino acid transport protein AzlD
MKPFFSSKRKMIEILVLLIINLFTYVLWSDGKFVALFSLGFVWNWVASQDLQLILENRRYRLSLLRVVCGTHMIIQKPFMSAPEVVKILLRVLPAGLFWMIIIYFNDSSMPWWAVFIGSLIYELISLEMKFFHKESNQ